MTSSALSRDPRVHIYAGFDLLMALLQATLITWIAPPFRAGPALFLWALVAVLLVTGAGMIAGRRWGWRVAVGGCGILLALELVLLILILSSAAFLAGAYGSFGRGGAGLAIVAALLSIQMIALLPALQLKFLLTRGGRRAFR